MSGTRTSFWRDAARTYILYMIAGLAIIPTAAVYAALAATGWDRWWSTLLLLSLGVSCGLIAWRVCERRIAFRRDVIIRVDQPVDSAAAFQPIAGGSAAGAAAMFSAALVVGPGSKGNLTIRAQSVANLPEPATAKAVHFAV